MSLAAGERLGPYVITAPLGAGGMGEVYRARDPRLNRDVAIKILRGSAVNDSEWRLRFTHEAHALSGLSHPNIVTVHDIGTEGDLAYMVMELVDGQTLDRMIPAGGLRVGEILRIGAQIADACAKAHATGVIHRDLKPANVMVEPDGRVRVLDFGIAKLMAPAQVMAGALSDATGTSPGVVLGTAAYMSPEQAEGRPIDGRSDIFSLGTMLYEMCCGQRPFRGDSAVTVMAAVLNQEPSPLGAVKPELPSELVRLITRCLRKDPARRVQSMADLKVALEELRDDADSGRLTAHAAATSPRRRSGLMVIGAAAALLLAVGGFAVWSASRGSPVSDEQPQPVPLTSFAGTEAEPTFSPDGTQIAFRWDGERQDNSDIYVMLISGGTPLRLTTDPRLDYGPQWSPDGRRIAFVRVLERGHVAIVLVSPLGGPERTLGEFYSTADLGGGLIAGVTWTPDSRFLFVSGSDKPGAPNRIVRLNADTGETLLAAAPGDTGRGYASPAISPDGRTLAMVHPDTPRGIELLALSEAFEPAGMKPFPAVPNIFTVHWTPDGKALLVTYFVNVPLPIFRMPASGGEVKPLSWIGPGAGGQFAIHGKRMVFERNSRDTNIIRVDLQRTGTAGPAIDRIAQSSFRDVAPQYSPDGSRLVFYSNRSGTVQIWTANADGSQATQLTTMDPLATTGTPRWSPDGKEISFDSNSGGFYHIYAVGSSGGKPRALTSGQTNNFVSAWSPDGKWIYFTSNRTGTNQIWRLPREGGTAEQVTQSGASSPQFSPDGAWMYFTRTDNGEALWRVPAKGGTPVKLVSRIYRYNYAVTDAGVYYLVPNDKGAVETTGTLFYQDFASGTARPILSIDKPLDLGLALSPDRRYVLFTQVDYAGQDLMMADNFR